MRHCVCEPALLFALPVRWFQAGGLKKFQTARNLNSVRTSAFSWRELKIFEEKRLRKARADAPFRMPPLGGPGNTLLRVSPAGLRACELCSLRCVPRGRSFPIEVES